MTLEMAYAHKPEDLTAWPPSAETRKCPFSFYDEAREKSPLYRYPEPHPLSGRPIFFATGWDAANYVLSHVEEFDSKLGDALPEMGNLAAAPYPDVPSHYEAPGIAFTYGEDHAVKRSWANMLFEADRMKNYLPIIEEVADRLIDEFIDQGTVNITDALAEALPLEVLTIIMGLPREDAKDLKSWTDIVTRLGMNSDPDPAEVEAATKALEDSGEYAYRQAVDRLENPRDDYMTAVVQAQVERDGELDKNAIVVHIRSMFLAAYHTTAAMLAAATVHMAQMPDSQQELREQPTKLRKFVEESVRLEGPLQWHPRVAMKDTNVAGTDVPEGSVVFVSFAAGSHDPAKFENPYTFDPSRRNVAQHLSFGAGPHRCPGAPLARLYAQAAFTRLLSRTKSFELDEEASDLTPLPGFNFRIPTRVVLKFRKA
ncbi:cytochrome P450 [Microbacterium sp. A196]|uniref:cytochrome P450 n=1 Tax=unclassified Microbacterium TaxID=2609290 RepID=UPI003FD5A4C6